MHRRDQGSLLANYNSLRDDHLATFNSDPKRLRHFKQMGLITDENVILDERRVRDNLVRRRQQKQTNGMLADSVVSRAIDLERKRRIDIKRKLEFLDKIEKVEKVKNMRYHPLGIQEFDPYEATPSPGGPNASTDKYIKDLERRKARLGGTTPSDFRIVPGRSQSPYMDIRILSKSLGIPVIKPRPPSAPRPVQSYSRARRGVTMRRVQTVPFTIPKPSVFHTNTKITLCYVGKSVSLNGYRSFEGSEVMVVQQHCGGNTLTLYQGTVKPKETFQFVSKRHVGSPFGLTIYLDGMMDVRVSGCCEYRHGVGKMLGRTIAHFKVVNIEGGSPCFRCKDARDGRLRSVIAHSSQASYGNGRLEPKPPKISPIRNDREMPEGTPKKTSSIGTPQKTSSKGTPKKTSSIGTPKKTSSIGTPKKTSSKGTPKKTPTKASSKTPTRNAKKTKRKSVTSFSRKSSQASNQSKTEIDDGYLEHEGSGSGSVYEYSSDSSAEDSAAGNTVVEAVSSDEMSVKYSDYKYQIEVSSDEGSAEELVDKRASDGNKSESESETDTDEETRQAEDEPLPSVDAKSPDKEDELSDKASYKEEQSSEDESQAEESLKGENLSAEGRSGEDELSDKESDKYESTSEDESQKVDGSQAEESLKDEEEFEVQSDELPEKEQDHLEEEESEAGEISAEDEQLPANEDLPAEESPSEDELPDLPADEGAVEKTEDKLSELSTGSLHREQLPAEDEQSVKEERSESNQTLEGDTNDSLLERTVPS